MPVDFLFFIGGRGGGGDVGWQFHNQYSRISYFLIENLISTYFRIYHIGKVGSVYTYMKMYIPP